MNMLQLYIMCIAVLATIACILPGTFLMLRGVALLSDAISHAILPGIVIMALLLKNIDSPLLIVGAACAGILTVLTTEIIIQSKRLKKDAAIGLVFPVFFSIGIVLISLYARTIHLDLDMVLLGELAFTPFNRLILCGIDLGPYAIWTMSSIVILNVLFVIGWYKQLVISTFDATLAHMHGFSSSRIYYGLMIITSITAVSTLHVVGSTIIVALMLTAPATAFLLTDKLTPLIGLSICVGATSAISGYTLAHGGNFSIAGSIACVSGLIFIIVFIGAPKKGLCARLLFNHTQQRMLASAVVCSFLADCTAATLPHIATNLNWSPRYTQTILNYALQQGYVMRMHTTYALTQQGKTTLFDQCL